MTTGKYETGSATVPEQAPFVGAREGRNCRVVGRAVGVYDVRRDSSRACCDGCSPKRLAAVSADEMAAMKPAAVMLPSELNTTVAELDGTVTVSGWLPVRVVCNTEAMVLLPLYTLMKS